MKHPLILVFSCLAMSLPVWAQNTVAVHVLDSNQKPIANAQVAVSIWGQKKSRQETLRTDATGTVKITLEKPLDPKKVVGRVAVHANGFALGGGPIKSDPLDFKLQPGTTWHGQAVDGAGKPIEGAKVVVTFMRDKGAAQVDYHAVDGEEIGKAYTALSAPDGSFQLADLPVGGTVNYTISKSGFATTNGTLPVSSAEPARIALGPDAKIHGKLLGVDGKPFAGVEVFASAMQFGEGYSTAKTAADGTYTLEGLPAGEYRVGSRERDNPSYIVQSVQHVMAEVNKTLEVPELRAVEGVVVSGFVRDKATGKPLADVGITSNKVGVSGDYTSSDGTGEDGRFSLRVVPGKIRFSVNSIPEGYLNDGNEQVLDITDKAPDLLTFEIQKAPIITGTILDENNRPVKTELKLWSGWGDGLKSDAQGRWSWQATSMAPIQASGGEDESGYFEIINNKAWPIPSDTPIVFKVRKHPWQSLEGRIVSRDNKPLAGVEVKATYFVTAGDDGAINQSERTTTTDADGRYVLPRIRAAKDMSSIVDNLKVSATGKGLVFVRGGDPAEKDGKWTATDIVLTSLNRRIEGQTEPGARVVAAGKETQADDKGHFVFEGLPDGELLVASAKDGKFGSALASDNATPVRLELLPLKAQGVDVEAGLQMWRDVARDGVESKFYALDWLNWQLAAPKGETFESLKRTDDGPTGLTGDRILSGRIIKLAPTLPTENRVARLDEVIKGINSPEIRLSTWLGVAMKLNDPAVGKRALQEADATLGQAPPEFDWRESSLYRLAVVNQMVKGEAAGVEALNAAIKWTLSHHPEKPFKENGRQTEITRDQMLRFEADDVAQGSKAMLRQLLDSIDPDSGEQVQAYGAAIPAVAESHGVDEAVALLDELVKLPKPESKEGTRLLNSDPQWAFNQAARRVLPLLGKKSPQRALELAERVTDPEDHAKALSIAAQFQTPEQAAKMWRAAVENADVTEAPRFAAQAWESDPKLGVELFALARQRAQAAAKADPEQMMGNPWSAYGFYFARVDPASARLELERSWGEQLLKMDSDGRNFPRIAMAMSAVDAKRALDMAKAIPKGNDNFWPLHTRVKIAQYLMATTEQRRDFPFARWGATDTWQVGDEDW